MEGWPWKMPSDMGQLHGPWCKHPLRATSHMRLRARDHYTSSTLIGVQGRPGPSSLHTTLEGPTTYVNATRWM
jgi:hypothetical protein